MMHNRRIFTSILALAIMLALLPAFDEAKAGGMWSSWLFNYGMEHDGTQGQPMLVRVYQDGTVEEHAFPVPEGAMLQAPPIVFSGGGNWVAFCAHDDEGTTLFVDDLYDGADGVADHYGITFPVVHDLGTIANCPISEASFSLGSDGLLALGVMNYFVGDPNADTSLPVWELQILDLATGEVEQVLTADSPAMTELTPFSGNSDISLMPQIRRYDGDVYFSLTLAGMGGGRPIYEGYVWNVVTNTVSPAPLYDYMRLDTIYLVGEGGLIQGTETIWTAIDESIALPPQTENMGPMRPDNVVMYSNNSGEQRIIFEQADGLFDAVFVDNGRHIAISVPTYGTIGLERDGTLQGLPVGQHAGPLTGAPDGYAFVDMDVATLTARFIYHRFAADGHTIEPTVLWETSDYRGQGWMMVWSAPMPGIGDLEPFPAMTP
jgi:hypothetical protein